MSNNSTNGKERPLLNVSEQEVLQVLEGFAGKDDGRKPSLAEVQNAMKAKGLGFHVATIGKIWTSLEDKGYIKSIPERFVILKRLEIVNQEGVPA